MIWFNRPAVAGVRCRPTLRTTRTGRRPAHMHAQGSTILMQASEAHIGRSAHPPGHASLEKADNRVTCRKCHERSRAPEFVVLTMPRV